MTGKLTAGDLLDIAEDIPCGWAGDSIYDRFFTSLSYDRIKNRWPHCQIVRRWESQSDCVDALIAAEIAAIVANGEPYAYDPWAGRCAIPLEVGDPLTIATTSPGTGATVEISSVAGCTVSATSVTAAGQKYARELHELPDFALSGGSGTGATFSTSWAVVRVTDDEAFFGVANAPTTNAVGGTGYVDGENLTVTASLPGYAPAGSFLVTVIPAVVTVQASGGVATGATVTTQGEYYWINADYPTQLYDTWAYDSRGSTTYGDRKYDVTVDNTVGSPTFGQVTGVTYTADEDFATGSFAATPTSSLTVAEREFMMQGFCPQHNAGNFTGFWEPLASYESVTFDDVAEVEDQIAILYGSAGPMDAATLYRGYCSDRTLVNSKASDATFYAPAGWSTPYRRGEVLTSTKLRAQCETPRLTASAPTGRLASLSVTMAQDANPEHWYVSSVSVLKGGREYVDESSVTFTVESGTQQTVATAKIQTVDGVIQSVDVLTGGQYTAPAGLPWKRQPDAGTYPEVFAAHSLAYFWSDDLPPVRAVALNGSTGDTVVDRLLETGTQDIQVIRDELDDELEDYTKTVTLLDRETCGDLGAFGGPDVGITRDPGLKRMEIVITKSASAVLLFTWVLELTFYACSSPEADPPSGTGISLTYTLTETDHSIPSTVTLTLIDSSADITAYESQADCEAQNLRPDGSCTGTQWEIWEPEPSMVLDCCSDDAAGDDDQYDDETP